MNARLPSPEHVDVLRRRGAQLARPPRHAEAAQTQPAIVAVLGQESYAIDARRVLEVVVLRDLMPLPGAREPLFGLTHWRGRIVAVLDLRAALGVRVQGLSDLSRLVVIDAPRPFGVLADSVREMADIDPQQIQPLQHADDASGGLIVGTTGDALLVIDADALIRRFAVRSADHPG